MGQELALWRPRRTTLSLEQKAEQSRAALRYETSSIDGLKAAKKLVGQWPHLKADQPDVFIASIGAVLSEYPFGLVEECVDPRTGPASKIKFLSIAELRAWLDERLDFHKVLSKHVSRPALPAPEPREYTDEHRRSMLGRLVIVFQTLAKTRREHDPIDELRRQTREREQAAHAIAHAAVMAELQSAPRAEEGVG